MILKLDSVTVQPVSHLFDRADGGDVVDLSTPLVVAVVLPLLSHIPQVLTTPVVVMLETDPSSCEAEARVTDGDKPEQKEKIKRDD